MGLITARHGERKFTVQLEAHSTGGVELPVGQLEAIFLEYTKLPKAPREIAEILQRKTLSPKDSSIIGRAKRTGGEIWLGDLTPTEAEKRNHAGAIIAGTLVAGGAATLAALSSRRKFLKTLGVLAGAAAAHPFTHGELLESPGDANGRIISKTLTSAYGKPFSVVDLRNRVMCHQIKALAERSGHTNIGVVVGAGHVDLANMLEKGYELSEKEKTEIRKREEEAGRMFRCRFDKTKGRWKVEKYQL